MRLSFWKRKEIDPENSVAFQCNICGTFCRIGRSSLDRETPSCRKCSSSVRMRSIVHLLSLALFDKSLLLRDFPTRHDLQGIGMSDWDGYAIPLTKTLGYTNTFYHKDPKLDITSIDSWSENSLDFIISTDVFEHVAPPVSTAFRNAWRLLKPGGVLIFSVPYSVETRSTKEHFPELHDYIVTKKNGKYELHNVTSNGEKQIFDNPVFHGGEGSTVEMRVFSRDSLLEEFREAGFSSVEIFHEDYMPYGIIWTDIHWSLPIVARR